MPLNINKVRIDGLEVEKYIEEQMKIENPFVSLKNLEIMIKEEVERYIQTLNNKGVVQATNDITGNDKRTVIGYK